MAQTIGHWQKQQGLCWPRAQEAPRGTGGEQPAPEGTSWAWSQGRAEQIRSRSCQGEQGFGPGQCPPLHSWLSSANSPGPALGHSHRGLEVSIPSHGPYLAQLRCQEGQGHVLEGTINHQSPPECPGIHSVTADSAKLPPGEVPGRSPKPEPALTQGTWSFWGFPNPPRDPAWDHHLDQGQGHCNNQNQVLLQDPYFLSFPLYIKYYCNAFILLEMETKRAPNPLYTATKLF